MKRLGDTGRLALNARAIISGLILSLSAVASGAQSGVAENPEGSPRPPWSVELRNVDGVSLSLKSADTRYLVFFEKLQEQFAVLAPGVQSTLAVPINLHPSVTQIFERSDGLALIGYDAGRISGVSPLGETVSFLLGDDRSKWLQAMPVYNKVRFEHFYDGIDLEVSFEPYGEVYRFEIASSADPSQIRTRPGARFEGRIATRQQDWRHPIKAEFRFVPMEGQRLTVGRYDSSRPIEVVIDVLREPDLVDHPGRAVRDSASFRTSRIFRSSEGATWIVSEASVKGDEGILQRRPATDPTMIAVTRFDDRGERKATWFISGFSLDDAGLTSGTERFAIWGRVGAFGPCQPTDAPDFQSAEAVMEIREDSSAGPCLAWGARPFVDGRVAAYGSDGLLWLVTPRYRNTKIPSVSFGHHSGLEGGTVHVTILKSSDELEIVASGYVPPAAQYVAALSPAPDGGMYVAGRTTDTELPSGPLSLQTRHAGGTYDPFVARLGRDHSGNISVTAATYFGGADENSFGVETISALAPGPGGSLWLAGTTSSRSLHFSDGAWQRQNPGAESGFVARLDPQLERLLGGTFLGGEEDDSVAAIAPDTVGNLWLIGVTESSAFPQRRTVLHLDDKAHAFLARINATGTHLLDSVVIAGTDEVNQGTIVTIADGRAWLVGQSVALMNPEKNSPARDWKALQRVMVLEASLCSLCSKSPEVTRIMDFRNSGKGVRLHVSGSGKIGDVYADGVKVPHRLVDGRIEVNAPLEAREIAVVDESGSSALVQLSAKSVASVSQTGYNKPEESISIWPWATVVGLVGFLLLLGRRP